MSTKCVELEKNVVHKLNFCEIFATVCLYISIVYSSMECGVQSIK